MCTYLYAERKGQRMAMEWWGIVKMVIAPATGYESQSTYLQHVMASRMWNDQCDLQLPQFHYEHYQNDAKEKDDDLPYYFIYKDDHRWENADYLLLPQLSMVTN